MGSETTEIPFVVTEAREGFSIGISSDEPVENESVNITCVASRYRLNSNDTSLIRWSFLPYASNDSNTQMQLNETSDGWTVIKSVTKLDVRSDVVLSKANSSLHSGMYTCSISKSNTDSENASTLSSMSTTVVISKEKKGEKGRRRGRRNSLYVILTLVSFVMFIVMALFFFITHVKYSRDRKNKMNLMLDGNELLSFPRDDWEFPRKNLLFSRILGEGNFGLVWLSDIIDLSSDEKTEKKVAVKMLKQIHSEQQNRDLLSELTIMKMLGSHPNVVSLMGCCSLQEPVYLIMEYLPNGNLRYFLKENRVDYENSNQLTAQNLTSFSYQIANGMEFVSSKDVSIQ